MSGKVVKKILKDAEDKAKEILQKAQEEASSRISAVENENKELLKRTKKEVEALRHQEITKILDMETLEMKKKILTEKRKIIDEVYKKCLDEIRNMDKEKYRKLIASLIVKYFSSGDEEVLIGQKDKKILAGIVDEINKSKGLHLKESNEEVWIDRGVILKKNRVYTNLSLTAILKEVFEEMQPEIIRGLFKNVS